MRRELLLIPALLISNNAIALENDPYAKLSLRGVGASEVAYEISGAEDFTNYEIGYGASAELGQYIADKLHASIEASYGISEFEDSSFPNNKAEILAILVNANYDFVEEDGVTIYGSIGGGLATNLDAEESDDFKPAWQTGAGARYNMSKIADLVLGYKYFGIPDGFELTNINTKFEDYTSHNVEVGLQFNFQMKQS